MGKVKDITAEREVIVKHLLESKNLNINRIAKKCNIYKQSVRRIKEMLINNMLVCSKRKKV